MSMQQHITQKLTENLQPLYLQVINESYMHSVPKGSESHFKLTIVSDHFTHLNRIKRHQLVYQLLSEEMASTIHALSMHCYTLAEWEANGQTRPDSPHCRGGFGK